MSAPIEAPKQFFQANADHITIVDGDGHATTVRLHELDPEDPGPILQYAQVLATTQVASALHDFVQAFSVARESGLDEDQFFERIVNLAAKAKAVL